MNLIKKMMEILFDEKTGMLELVSDKEWFCNECMEYFHQDQLEQHIREKHMEIKP